MTRKRALENLYETAKDLKGKDINDVLLQLINQVDDIQKMEEQVKNEMTESFDVPEKAGKEIEVIDQRAGLLRAQRDYSDDAILISTGLFVGSLIGWLIPWL